MSVQLERDIKRLEEFGYNLAAGILRPVVRALAESELLPERLQHIQGENTARVISSTSEGPYLSAKVMKGLAEDWAKTGSVRSYAECAANQIAKFGDDALCHLILPRLIWNRLMRADIMTISSLEAYLYKNENTLMELPGFGKDRSDRVIQALIDFRIRLDAAESSTQ